MSKRGILSFILLLILFTSLHAATVRASPVDVQILVVVLNVEKVDLSENSHRIDFYFQVEFDPSKISMDEIRQFQFVNGEPAVKELLVEEETRRTIILYKVKGDFITQFELGKYPFDSHSIEILVDYPYISEDLNFEPYVVAYDEMVIVGWDYLGIESRVEEHSYLEDGNPAPMAVFSINIRRPLLSTILKNIMPITVISSIALLTFLISPSNPAQRIGLGVSTLLSATAFHLSLLGGIPPTGAFTIADGIMLSSYLLHFYSLLISVYLMRLKDSEEPMRAEKVNKKAMILLPVIIVVPIAIAVLLNL